MGKSKAYGVVLEAPPALESFVNGVAYSAKEGGFKWLRGRKQIEVYDPARFERLLDHLIANFIPEPQSTQFSTAGRLLQKLWGEADPEYAPRTVTQQVAEWDQAINGSSSCVPGIEICYVQPIVECLKEALELLRQSGYPPGVEFALSTKYATLGKAKHE